MTKINIRSPFYLRYDEPALPSVTLDCDLINLENMTIDQFGNITPPDLDYGSILSYTSSDVDFADGKFDTVLSDTPRTVTFTISIPNNFTNASDETIDCDATFTQPAFVCTGGVTLNGSIPSQSLDTGGDSVEIDLTSYFTAGTDPISSYTVTNSYPTYISTSVNEDTLRIYSANRTGTVTIYVEASDGNDATCNATQSISITLSASVTYDCDYVFFSGGSIANDGTITNPTVNGTITAIKETSGGASITSYSANNTGSAREVTLYFDITVPSGVGYTNAGATVECPKTFTQSSTTLPQFTCEVAGLTGQAIAVNGTIKMGTANKGTISGFSPLSFEGYLTTATERTVAFNITPPASGYANSGGSDISCNVTMTQPATLPPSAGTITWGIAPAYYDFLSREQYEAAGHTYVLTYSSGQRDDYNKTRLYVLQGKLEHVYTCTFYSRNIRVYLNSDNLLDNIGSGVFSDTSGTPPAFVTDVLHSERYAPYRLNPTGGAYFRIGKNVAIRSNYGQCPSVIQSDIYSPPYYIKIEPNYVISEIWSANLLTKTFTKLA